MISIHALREEGDQVQGALDRKPEKFLSTPSARRATPSSIASRFAWKFLSTPSARRATLGKALHHGGCSISIHALREEGDHIIAENFHIKRISIHALREEGDRGASAVASSSV